MYTSLIQFTATILFLCLGKLSYAQSFDHMKNIYFIPGQGADERLFKNLEFDASEFEVHYVKYEIPLKGEDMRSYALRLSKQIDTTKPFYLVGVSLGGMIATEMNEIISPKKVVVISSAKCRNELPAPYRFQKYLPIHKLIPKGLVKLSTFVVQPLFEPDRKKEKATCVAMLKAKDPLFLKRSIDMIVNWDRINFDPAIVHIHGNNDNTLPIRNVNHDFLIEDGSHMMTLTRTPEIKEILLRELGEK